MIPKKPDPIKSFKIRKGTFIDKLYVYSFPIDGEEYLTLEISNHNVNWKEPKKTNFRMTYAQAKEIIDYLSGLVNTKDTTEQ